MICLAFHQIEEFLDHIDRQLFRIVLVRNNQELPDIERTHDNADGKNVLFIRGIDRLYSFENQTLLDAFKIFVFDSPHNFFRHRLIFSDVLKHRNGVWPFRPIPPALFRQWIADMETGIEQFVDTDLKTLLWSYSD